MWVISPFHVFFVFDLEPLTLWINRCILFIVCSVCNCTDIGAEFGDVRPLDEIRMRAMIVNGIQLLDRIVADLLFVTELANAECITWPQREHLISIALPRDRNYKLLEFLTRRSVADFGKFIKVLSKEQSFLVPLLLTNGGEKLLVCVSNFYPPVVLIIAHLATLLSINTIERKPVLKQCCCISVCLLDWWGIVEKWLI